MRIRQRDHIQYVKQHRKHHRHAPPKLVERQQSIANPISVLSAKIKATAKFPAVVSAVAPVADPLIWLRNQNSDFKILWSDRQSEGCIVGDGISAQVTGGYDESVESIISRCRVLIKEHPTLRCFGGFRFQSNQSSSEWESFAAAKFWIPRLTFDGQRISCVVLCENDVAEALRKVEAIADAPSQPLSPIPPWIARRDAPDREGWTRNVSRAIDLFRRELLEKLVLARKATFTFDRPSRRNRTNFTI